MHPNTCMSNLLTSFQVLQMTHATDVQHSCRCLQLELLRGTILQLINADTSTLILVFLHVCLLQPQLKSGVRCG